MLWQIGFLIVGILCLLYYAALCIALRKWDSTFSRFWLVFGAASLLCCYVYEFGEKIIRQYQVILAIPVTAAVVVFGVTECCIIKGMYSGKYIEYPYLIVLGAQVDRKRITDSLRRRLDRAVRYLREHPRTQVIVSGGMGKKEEIPEAEAMAAYLLESGIEKERIFQEDRSRTTKENLLFSRIYIEDINQPVGIVSNNFHLYRAICYARQAGYGNAYPVAADCNRLLLLNYMVREFFAVWKMWLMNRKVWNR